MSTISFRSNIMADRTLRWLDRSTDSLRRASEKLSSGMRINRPSDDPAGRAIGTDLSFSADISDQRVRNFNDAQSVLNVATGAIDGLSQIVTRMQELAEQAANGTFAGAQRASLNRESEALEQEYFRIIRATKFNNLELLSGDIDDVEVDAESLGRENGIRLSIADLSGGGQRLVNDGTFQSAVSTPIAASLAGSQYATSAVGDVNNDGNEDLAAADIINGTLFVSLGNGDGTFGPSISLLGGAQLEGIGLADLNGDNFDDVVVSNYGNDSIDVHLSNGNGTFSSPTTTGTAGLGPASLRLEDVDGDGNIDAIAGMFDSNQMQVLYGDGSGGFAGVTLLGVGINPEDVEVADLNNDGLKDIITANRNSNSVSVRLQTAPRTFGAENQYNTSLPYTMGKGDFNRDGYMDLVTADYSTNNFYVLFNNGDGSFASATPFATAAAPSFVTVGDYTGDGNLDIGGLVGNTIGYTPGNGDGTFGSFVSVGSTVYALGITNADLNNDHVNDLVYIENGSAPFRDIAAMIGNSTIGAGVFDVSMATIDEARDALETLRAQIQFLALEKGNIGAISSRVDFAQSVTSQESLSSGQASSQILDADVADAAAGVVVAQLKQSTGAQLLSRVVSETEIGLTLLNEIA